VLQRVLHQQLHAERCHVPGQGGGRHADFDHQVGPKPDFLQRQVGFNKRHFIGQRHRGLALGQQHVAVHIGQLLHKLLGRRIARLDEGRKGVEVIEQKMRVELALQRVELGLGGGPGQLVGAAQVGLPLLKKVRGFIQREHGPGRHQTETDFAQQPGRRERKKARH